MSKPPWEDSDIPDPVNELPPVTAYNQAGEPASTKPAYRLHTVHGYIIRETEKAILIQVYQVDGKDTETPDDERKRDIWFPLSQVSTIHRDNGTDGSYDYIRVKEWLCKQKGLI